MVKNFLMILHEMGTIDHAVALKSQIQNAGGLVQHVLVGQSELPSWALSHFPLAHQLTEHEALQTLRDFSAVWLPEPYETLRPVEWRNLWESVPVVYSGYTLPLFDWKHGLYELPFFDHCARILAPGPRDEIEHLRAGSGLRRVLLSGDPLMFEVVKLRQTSMQGESNATILWAPHWSKGWTDGSDGFSAWEWVVEVLYCFFKHHPKINLVVRPHPHLSFNEGSYGARRMSRKLFALKNVSRSQESMLSDIAESDLLLSEGIAILAYFGATGKPVVVVGNKGRTAPFSDLGHHLVGRMLSVEDETQLDLLLSDFASARHRFFPKSRELSDAILDNFIVRDISPGESLLDTF